MTDLDRRSFLRRGATAAAGGALLGGPFAGLTATSATAVGRRPDFRRLRPVADERDGVVRLHLPAGFRYRSFNPAGSPLSDGTATPSFHDGMAAFRGHRGHTVLVRNHEVNGPVGAFGDRATAYDPMAGGGCVRLVLSPRGDVVHSEVAINGTQMNCSGGPMPWGSWVTCEETVNGPDVGNDFTGGDNSLLHEKHGYVFDVPARGRASGEPVRMAGRFAHESAVFDTHTGAVYLTEDNFGFPSGLYRYLPPRDPRWAGRLEDGGRLQMLAVAGRPNADLSVAQPRRATYRVEWVDVDDPDPSFPAGTTNDEAIQAVGAQGRDRGGAIFSRLEGAIEDRGVVYFTSTQGGPTADGDDAPSGFGDGRGQVWALHPRSGRLRLLYESPSSVELDLPDNVTASPRGTLVLCEDGDGDNYLRGLSRGGHLWDLALNRVPGQEDQEFAGSTFSADGDTLFVNIQAEQGLTFAIRGPWARAGF